MRVLKICYCRLISDVGILKKTVVGHTGHLGISIYWVTGNSLNSDFSLGRKLALFILGQVFMCLVSHILHVNPGRWYMLEYILHASTHIVSVMCMLDRQEGFEIIPLGLQGWCSVIVQTGFSTAYHSESLNTFSPFYCWSLTLLPYEKSSTREG